MKPREAEFYSVLADAWQRLGKLPEAVSSYEQALRLKRDSPRELLMLAGALKASGQTARADEAVKRAVRLAPDSAVVAWFQGGALDPDVPGARAGLAEILWLTGKANRAESELREALRTDPYDASAYDLRGRVLAYEGHAPEALFDFEQATKLRPGYAPHLYN